MMLFGSTSPSYLILQSLDAANQYLADYPERLRVFTQRVDALKDTLRCRGYVLYGSEPLKITIAAKAYGYTGDELADYLRQQAMEPEFADPDYLVLMLTPEITETQLQRLEDALCKLHKQPARRDGANLPFRNTGNVHSGSYAGGFGNSARSPVP